MIVPLAPRSPESLEAWTRSATIPKTTIGALGLPGSVLDLTGRRPQSLPRPDPEIRLASMSWPAGGVLTHVRTPRSPVAPVAALLSQRLSPRAARSNCGELGASSYHCLRAPAPHLLSAGRCHPKTTSRRRKDSTFGDRPDGLVVNNRCGINEQRRADAASGSTQ